jgi:tetratricopeptide (TPR) repeat protein
VERARLLEAAAALVEWASADRPVALVVEDVHAADAASLELAAYVGRRLTRLPVLLVVTRRELPRRADVDAVEHELRARGALAGELALEPLDGAAVARLASAVAALEAEQVEAVVGEAGGNALIAVETARAIARGETGPAASLRGAVRAAFRGLPEDGRLVAELAAVAGRPLERAELTELGVEHPAHAATLALETGILTWRDTAIGYRHALLREAAYADLSEPRRAALHEEVATVLAARDGSAGDRRAGEAARHFRLAGRDDLAVGQLARAAAHARSVAALDQAAAILREALEIDGDRADLLVELAEVEAWRGRRESSDAAFELARPKLEGDGGIELADAWLRRSRWYHGPICYPHGVATVSRRVLEVLDRLTGDHTAARAEATAALAWTEAIAGDVDRADELLAEVEALVQESPDAERLTYDIGHARSLALVRRGRFEESYAPAIEAGEAAERMGRPDYAFGCWVNAAGAATATGDHDRALSFLARSEQAVRGRGMLGVEAQIHAARSTVLARMGRLADARDAAHAERETAELAGDPEMLASAAHDCGVVALAMGDHDAAQRLLREALQAPAPISRPLARLARAEALARLDRCEEAEEELRATALEPVGPADFPDTLVPRLTRVQGLVAAARGDHALAARRLEQAADGWRRSVVARSGDRLTSVLADFGRPVLGLVDPDHELELVLADLHALGAPAA